MVTVYFERLAVWQQSAALSADLYTYFQQCRDFGFRDQITRSGLSIPSNISEGITRATRKDKLRLINIAYGSCAELRTQIYIGTKINYIDTETSRKWIGETQQIAAMLYKLTQSIQNSEQ